MYKLSTTDAAFLHMETERAPMHVASVHIMELPSGVTETAYIAGLKRYVLERIELVPYLTNRLQSTPLDLDNPVWVRAEDFDIDRHIYAVPVSAPGGQAEFEAAVARVHEEPMDRAHPLWEYALLCGLENGRVAIYSRVHHAAIDGMAGRAATELLMDTTADHAARQLPAAAPANHLGDYRPAELWLHALERFNKGAIDGATSALDALAAMARLTQRALDPDKGYGVAFERAPRTRFNRSVSQARSYAVGEFALADCKAVAKAAGCTVNDVFLAACGGALRRYFSRTDELPDAPLLAGCPVSLRAAADSASGNAVSMMKVSLGSHLADPADRLAHVNASANAAKGVLADSADLFSAEAAVPGMPLLARSAARANEALGLSEWLDPAVNVVVSNVPGPRQTLFANGAKVLTYYPVSIPAHGNGVNITVQSYVDGMYFAVTGCAEALPDPQLLRDDLLAAFAELCSALPSSVLSFERQRLEPASVPEKKHNKDAEQAKVA